MLKRIQMILAGLTQRFRGFGPIAPGHRLAVAGRIMALGFRRYWLTGLALISAMAAFLMTQYYVDTKILRERERLLPRGAMVEVLVAARDLSIGDLTSPVTVAVRRVPQDWSPPNTIGPLDFEAINQRPLARPLKAGHPITSEHLRPSTTMEGGLQIEPGFRAISIAVDEVSSVGGLIAPGDRIDLWVSAAPRPESNDGAIVSLIAEPAALQPQARMIAENLRVIATGGRTDRAIEPPSPASRGGIAGNAYATITLAVPEGVANLVLGGQLQGRFGIALRAPQEHQKVVSGKASSKRAGTVFGGPIEILIGGSDGVLR